MKKLFVVDDMGGFPCNFCWIAELVAEVRDNSLPFGDNIVTKFVENADPETSKFFGDREIHVPVLDYDGTEIWGASEFVNYLGVIHGIDSLRRGKT